MKNLIQRLKTGITTVFYLSLILAITACSDDEGTVECGCESPTTLVITDKDQRGGYLYYKHPELMDNYLDDLQYSNRFWIFLGTPGCYNCQKHLIICNEAVLSNEFDFLKKSNDSIPVRFAGELKTLCTEPFITPADYFYAEIKLESIEQIKNQGIH